MPTLKDRIGLLQRCLVELRTEIYEALLDRDYETAILKNRLFNELAAMLKGLGTSDVVFGFEEAYSAKKVVRR